MSRSRLVALACAAAALATSGTAVVASLSANGWRVSGLVRMSSGEPIADVARRHDPGFAFVPATSHYDGVYFYAIALDPLGRGEPARAIDRGPYRYGHAGYGWMAWLLSFGNARAAPLALLLLALAGVAVGAAAGSALASELGESPWAGLAVAFNPGIVYAVTVLTSEAVGIALLMTSLLAWIRGRRGWAAVGFVAACLTKEPFLLVPVGLGVWELVRAVRERGRAWPADRVLWERARLLVLAPAVFGAWYLYLIAHFDGLPRPPDGLLTWPFAGWVDSLRRAAALGLGSFDQAQLGTASVALLAASGAVLIAGIVAALRLATPVSPVYIGLALVVFSLSWLGVLYPKDLIREISMPVSLVPIVLVGHLGRPVPSAEPVP